MHLNQAIFDIIAVVDLSGADGLAGSVAVVIIRKADIAVAFKLVVGVVAPGTRHTGGGQPVAQRIIGVGLIGSQGVDGCGQPLQLVIRELRGRSSDSRIIKSNALRKRQIVEGKGFKLLKVGKSGYPRNVP